MAGSVVPSGVLGVLAARYVLGADLVPSLSFIGIGLGLQLEVLTEAAVTAGVLLPVAIIGKLGGTGLVVAVTSRWTTGLLIGASMVPGPRSR